MRLSIQFEVAVTPQFNDHCSSNQSSSVEAGGVQYRRCWVSTNNYMWLLRSNTLPEHDLSIILSQRVLGNCENPLAMGQTELGIDCSTRLLEEYLTNGIGL